VLRGERRLEPDPCDPDGDRERDRPATPAIRRPPQEPHRAQPESERDRGLERPLRDPVDEDATGVALELSDPAKAGKRALDIESEHGPIDILVNNAGILVSGDVLSVSPEDFLKSLQVNVASPFALINALGARMKRRGWGRIVNMSSGLGSFHEGLEGPAAYSVSKAALNAITVSAARTLGHAVKVNAACPGWVCTRMGGENAPRSPEEGADTPVWLARLPDDGPTGEFFRNRNSICW
jgi:NAD(P)-dependent dehydrogenase (short-subunit alcohol dehydrogenase family)